MTDVSAINQFRLHAALYLPEDAAGAGADAVLAANCARLARSASVNCAATGQAFPDLSRRSAMSGSASAPASPRRFLNPSPRMTKIAFLLPEHASSRKVFANARRKASPATLAASSRSRQAAN